MFTSKSPQDTQKHAQSILKSYPHIRLISLMGDLGSGKTTFSQGIGAYFGIKEMPSPTYTYVREYQIGPKKLIHYDLYRLKSYPELVVMGFEENLKDPHKLTLIEWADRVHSFLPTPRLDIYFTYLNESERNIITKFIK